MLAEDALLCYFGGWHIERSDLGKQAMATLEIVNGPNGRKLYELSRDSITIGRYPFCDIVLRLNSISRQHAQVIRAADGYYVEDLNSLNGTFVNGERIASRTRLRDKDQIHVYETLVKFHEGEPDDDEEDSPSQPTTASPPAAKSPNEPRATNIVNTLDASHPSLDVAAQEKLRAIVEINRILGSSLDVDEVLPKILDGLFDILPQSDRGYILFADEPSGELALRAIRDRGENTAVSSTLGPISYAMAARVMDRGEAVLSADAFNDDELEISESVLDFPIRSMMCAPLMGPKRKPLGIIYVDTSDPERRFDEEDLEVLLSVATTAGQAVEYAREHEASLKLHKQSEEKLKRYAAELEERNLELQQFAYIASHDLQEPLRSIASFSGLLERRYKGQLDEQADQWIDYLVEGAKRMKTLVQDMRTYTEVDRRAKPFAPTDCESVLSRVIENLRSSIEELGAQVDHDQLPTVSADATQLSQLFHNLLDNAIKFHGPQPLQVQIAAREDGENWVFSVRDNGIGIAPEHHKSIFEIFRRPHHKHEYSGTGIGLAVCQRIIRRHGGRIWVESEPGNGSLFSFTIPVQKDALG
jgi:signal transduction histidine kinase